MRNLAGADIASFFIEAVASDINATRIGNFDGFLWNSLAGNSDGVANIFIFGSITRNYSIFDGIIGRDARATGSATTTNRVGEAETSTLTIVAGKIANIIISVLISVGVACSCARRKITNYAIRCYC